MWLNFQTVAGFIVIGKILRVVSTFSNSDNAFVVLCEIGPWLRFHSFNFFTTF